MQMYRTIVDMMNKFQNDNPFTNGAHKTKLLDHFIEILENNAHMTFS